MAGTDPDIRTSRGSLPPHCGRARRLEGADIRDCRRLGPVSCRFVTDRARRRTRQLPKSFSTARSDWDWKAVIRASLCLQSRGGMTGRRNRPNTVIA
jgi:hypothetical protein